MKRTHIIIAIVLIAAFSRLLPHPDNFSPVAAIALFSGAFLGRSLGIFIPLISLLIGDLIMGSQDALYMEYLTSGQFATVYLSMILSSFIGMYIGKTVSVTSVLSGAMASSLVFYLITNFAFWYSGLLYPMNASGLVLSYTNAIPFYKWTLLGDLCYSAALFGSYYFIQRSRLQLIKL
ncbi:MAG TPA: DUF6580 family putative transport protein [Bacteroidia bacterium]|nr:DUF6580 family putative transport protein [Bacteroidia bacterium]